MGREQGGRKLDLLIGMARSHGGPEGTAIHLTVEDYAAGIQFLDVTLSLEQFANIATGSSVRVAGVVRGTALLGMRVEGVDHSVTLPPPPPGSWCPTPEQRAAAVAAVAATLPTDPPGSTPWVGRVEDTANHHRRLRKDAAGRDVYRVSFGRHVPSKGEAP